jgi:hypothetical protein
MTLPFTFYWANETETTFNPSTMNVFDEELLSFDIKHDEGQVPTLDIVIHNPRIGLLASGRKVWVWFAWQSDASDPTYAGALVPLFFGVLVGVPTSLFQEKVTLQFIARSPQFIANKQHLAETMKAAPYYDPIFIETNKRDDPDTILEGWSALWHVDRLTGVISASDILVGEDGNIEYDEDHALYDSVSLQLGQPPLTNIRVEASVNWTQRTSGYFTVPTVNISSYTGETLMSDWPKPGAGIGGGYKCEASFTTDTYLVSETPNTTYNYTWHNPDDNMSQCDPSSTSQASSGPALLAPKPLQNTLTLYAKSGLCCPDCDPPVNTAGECNSTGITIPLWNVALDMTIRYDANRQFSEELSFDMTANVQGILASPLVAQHTELLTINGVDVSQPLVEVYAWTDFAGRSVGLGETIFPNNPTTPGGLSYQICVGSGTAGTVEPVFSDIPGFTTYDNGVTWSSLGTQGVSQASAWSPGAFVPLGQIMLLQQQTFNINTGSFEDVPGQSSYYLCTIPGKTNGEYTIYSYTPPKISNVEPTPAIRHIDYIVQPTFSTSMGTSVTDGSVGWTVLGTSPALLGIPIGGTPDNITANNFFPTTRGIVSVEYLISRARARLRFRSRAVKIGWECRFRDAVALSCRKNATLFDPRLPGGAATGKVTSYSLSLSNGKIIGKVEIGCAIGFGDSINEITGTPEYASAGYAQVGYQRYDGAMVAHGSNDTTFSMPDLGGGFDDGLSFPLRWQDVMDSTDQPDGSTTPGLVSGDLVTQAAAIKKSFPVATQIAEEQYWAGVVISTTANPTSITSGISPTVAWALLRDQLKLISADTPYVMAANPISWSCLLKPCAGNGPFGGSYGIYVSPLVVPQGINLEAPSSP